MSDCSLKSSWSYHEFIMKLKDEDWQLKTNQDWTDGRTDERTLWLLELLSEPKMIARLMLQTIFFIFQVSELLCFVSMKLCLSWWLKAGSSERELARGVSRSHVTRVTWRDQCVSHVLESRARVRLSLRTLAIKTTHMWRGYRPNISVVMILPSFDTTNSFVKTSISRTWEIDD